MTHNLKDQRQILYATLLQYSPEIGSLRERVLDRLLLVALLGTSSTRPLAITSIRARTRVAPSAPSLRIDLIQTTLHRLRTRNLVEYTQNKGKPAYFLTELGRRDTDLAAAPVANLFDSALGSMLRDTEHLCSTDDARAILRTFLAECFARFGEAIAREMTGKIEGVHLPDGYDVDAAFRAATRSADLSEEAEASLRVRCVQFLRSRESRDRELRFRLTQGYYVAQLLGIDSGSFNPLADDSFRGAVFYLDTNVLLRSLLSDEHGRPLAELMRVCRHLKVDVRVSRATLDEAATAVSTRYESLRGLIARMPDELIERTKDHFVETFLTERIQNSGLTLEAFFGRFNALPNIVDELQITLDDRTAAEIVGSRDVSRECELVRTAALNTRGWAKPNAVCLHDVAHYLIVQEKREDQCKTWFLTHDRTLAHAAAHLQPNMLPFCLSLTAFLQSVSPFVETTDTRDSLVELFDAVLTGDVSDPTGDMLFSIEELKVIDEIRSDVHATPTDQLVRAVDHIKSTVLKGKPLTESDQKELRLELRKFLTSSTQDTLSELEEQVRLQRDSAESEKEKREEAEQHVKARDSKIKSLEASVRAEHDLRAKGERRQRSLELRVAVLGALAACGLWALDDAVVGTVVDLLRFGHDWRTGGQVVVRLIGSALFVGSLVPVLRRRSRGWAMHILAGAVAVAVAAGGVVPVDLVGTAASFLGLGCFLAVVLMNLAEWRDTRDPNDE